MNEELIAPCGMNCQVCSRYLALRHDVKSSGIRIIYCAGCRLRGKSCAFQKNCTLLRTGRVTYCYECSDFPCHRLNRIDARYRKYYRTSLIQNLEFISKHGIRRFLEREEQKWKCPDCGGVVSCHNGLCFDCGIDKLQTKKKLYRWED